MKAGAMFTTNPSTGANTPTGDVVLLASDDEAIMVIDALEMLSKARGEVIDATNNYIRSRFGWGPKTRAGEFMLVISKDDARQIYRGLDLYCTANPANKLAKELFHTFGWNSALLMTAGGA